MRNAVASYCVGVGLLMLVWWALEIRSGVLRRGDRAVVELKLHLSAEFLTSALLVVGGALLLTNQSKAVALVGLGMLLYTVIQSPGYFLARHQFPPAVMFGVLLVLTSSALFAVIST